MSTIGFETHDHGACVDDAMAAAEARCAASDLRLTPIRRRVLELLLAEHRALGAYDILGHLSAEGLGAQPPVAYRALDFLVKAGLAHRIEALNAYIACSHVGADHTPAFLICRKGPAGLASSMAACPRSDCARALAPQPMAGTRSRKNKRL